MPKMKTHKGMRKRFRVTPSGKVLSYPPGRGHLMSGKSGARKQDLSRRRRLRGRGVRKLRLLMGG